MKRPEQQKLCIVSQEAATIYKAMNENGINGCLSFSSLRVNANSVYLRFKHSRPCKHTITITTPITEAFNNEHLWAITESTGLHRECSCSIDAMRTQKYRNIELVLRSQQPVENIWSNRVDPGVFIGLSTIESEFVGCVGIIDFNVVAFDAFQGDETIRFLGTADDELKLSLERAYIYALYKCQQIERKFPEVSLKESSKRKKRFVVESVGQRNVSGPSSAIGYVAALISVVTETPIANGGHMALTGDISMNGDIVKVGSVFEKSIGAYLSGIKILIVPMANKEDADMLSTDVKMSLQILPANHFDEIFDTLFPSIPML